MRVDLKTLHLFRPILYEKTEPAGRVIRNSELGALAAWWKECLVEFADEKLFRMTDDGPRLSAGGLAPSSIYRIVAPQVSAGDTSAAAFTLPAADYVFFQWRIKSGVKSGAESELDPKSQPAPDIMFEEFAREVWWERLETEGPWFLRLVLEDGETAVQALRAMKRP